MPTTPEQNFDRKVRQIIDNIYRHERASIRQALRLLDAVRRDVIARIAETTTSEFNRSILRQIEASITRRIEEFRQALNIQLRGNLERAAELGVEAVDSPVSTLIRPSRVIGVSPQVVQVAADYSASLITSLSNSLRDQIDSTLKRAALGSLSPQDAIKAVGRSLKSRGVFKSIAARAETIVRTEVLRIQEIAAHARMLENRETMRRAGWALKKEWIASLDARVRPSHAAANGQVREVDEAFSVGGESLMYPRDPSGSAQETINCRCASASKVERLYLLDRKKKFER